MPISKVKLAENINANFMMNFRMGQKFDKAIEAVEEQKDPNNKELLSILHKARAGLGLLMLQATLDNMDDETYKEYMDLFNNLPVHLGKKVHPGDKTVLNLMMEGLSEEDKLKSSKEITQFYKAYELDFLKSAEERQAMQEEERKAEEERIRETEGDPLEVIPTFTEKQKKGKKKTAAKYIEDLKAGATSYATFTSTDTARILAARLLADSKIGYADRLIAKEVTDSEVEKTAEWIKKNTSFDTFFNQNGKKIYNAAKARGHGGGIDKLFKEYITNLPVGQLPSRVLYTRYMPTALERIDAIKKQIKSGDAKDIYAAAAEIAVLRNMVKAEKGEKSTLTRKLSPEQMANLKEQIETLSKDPSFREMLNDEKTRSLVTSGHGGDFLDRVRRSEKNHPNMSKNASAILNSGTLGAHIEGLKKQASDLFTELNDELTRVRNAPEAERDMGKAWETIEKSKKLLAEYIACDNISRKPVKGAVNTEARLLQDVPASKISEQVSKRDSNQAFNDLTKGISPAKTLEILHNLATKSPDEVLRGLAEQEPILPAEKKAVPKQEVKQQEGPAVNLPNN